MRLKMITAGALLALTAACATPATGPDAQKRFDSFSVTASSVDFASYESVYVAPVTASEGLQKLVGYRPVGPSDTKRPLRQSDIDDQASDLTEALRDRLGGQVAMAEAGGPDILTIAVEITKLEANRPTMADYDVEPGLSFESVYAGAAAVKITFSEDGTVLATASDADTPSLNESLPPAGIWSTADRFFFRLANKVAALFG